MHAWAIRGASLPLDRTLLMGVVNATPDSFSDGGAYEPTEHGLRLAAEGADLLDVGGESTRPGAADVAPDEEARRVVPVVRALASRGLVVSVDTRRASVAREALAAGARVVNDVSAGRDPEMLPLVAREGAGLVLMHMLGEPRSMQRDPQYKDVVREVCDFLVERARVAEAGGVAREAIALDPGIGFGKTSEHNLALLRDGVPALARAGHPVLVGASRKSFLGALTAFGGPAPPATDRLEATLAAHVMAVTGGANVIRAHDVAAHRRALAVADAIRGSG